MKVLMVWDGDYPWDVRVEKICNSLADEGAEVHLVSRNSKDLPRKELVGKINVRRVFSMPGFGRAFNAALTFPAFFSPFWLWEIYKTAKELKPDVLIARDLPMALGAVWVAKILNIPIIFDMAECYPEMLRCIWKFESFRVQNILVRNPFFADILEKAVIKNVDLVWTMIEESSDRLMKFGLPSSKAIVVSNTPPLAQEKAAFFESKNSNCLRVVYIGLLNPSRGLRTLVEAAALLKSKEFDFVVTVAGAGKDFEHLKNKVNELGLDKKVHLIGWVEHGEIRKILSEADIGIVPHYACGHWDNTIPNKLFDYMSASIPVLVSSAKPTARVVEETKCGLVYESQSAEDLAEKIMQMSDEAKRRFMGESGLLAVKNRYNWDFDKRVMLSSLSALAKKKMI